MNFSDILGRKMFVSTEENHEHEGRILTDRVRAILVEDAKHIRYRTGFDRK